jgi:hypothetical protein
MENKITFKNLCNEVNTIIDPLLEKVKDNNKFFMEIFLYYYVLGVFIENNKGKITLMYFFFPLFITQTFLEKGALLWWGFLALLVVLIVDLSLNRWKEYTAFLYEFHEKDALQNFFLKNNPVTEITLNLEEITDDSFILDAITYHHNGITLAEYEKVFISQGKDALSINDLTLVLLKMRLYEINLGNLEIVSGSLKKAIKPSFLKDSIFFIQVLFR